MTIFLDDRDYRQFIQLLRQAIERFKLACHEYCVMPNHYHLAIRPSLPNLSDALQHLNGRYAQWWNRRYAEVGHVFQGRFKSQVVDDERYALALCRYIALNPVRARLVQRPEDWRWSSYASAVGVRPTPSFLTANASLTLFGSGDESVLRQRLSSFVLAGSVDDVDDDRIRSSDLILGDVELMAQVQLPGSIDAVSAMNVAAGP